MNHWQLFNLGNIKNVSYIDPQFELLTWQHALRSANVEVLAVKTGTDLRLN